MPQGVGFKAPPVSLVKSRGFPFFRGAIGLIDNLTPNTTRWPILTPKSDAQTQGTFWTHMDEIQWPQPLCYDWVSNAGQGWTPTLRQTTGAGKRSGPSTSARSFWRISERIRADGPSQVKIWVRTGEANERVPPSPRPREWDGVGAGQRNRLHYRQALRPMRARASAGHR